MFCLKLKLRTQTNKYIIVGPITWFTIDNTNKLTFLADSWYIIIFDAHFYPSYIKEAAVLHVALSQ